MLSKYKEGLKLRVIINYVKWFFVRNYFWEKEFLIIGINLLLELSEGVVY